MALMSNLIRTKHGVYHYRKVIPATLRPALNGQREFRKSLNTKDPHEAKKFAHVVGVEFERKLEHARNGDTLSASQATDYDRAYRQRQQRRPRVRHRLQLEAEGEVCGQAAVSD